MSDAAGLDGVVLQSGGFRLLGALHRAAGPQPRPAVLLLHGIPGHEKNLDLAVDLRDRGVHCLHIHYRGSWGSGGEYALANLVPDAQVALEWLAAHPRVDPSSRRVGRHQPGGLGRAHPRQPGRRHLRGGGALTAARSTSPPAAA